MLQKCPQCGAEFPDDEQCHQRFDQCMAMEYENPNTFGAVHHLTVACYMLQHNRYSPDAWIEARKMVAQFLQEGITPAEMIRQNRSRLNSIHRRWSITKGAKLPEFNTIVWTRTMANIRFDNPKVYCADVKLWATSVLTDTELLLRKIGEV